MWARECKCSSKKDRLNFASMRFCTTPLYSKSFSSDKELREESLKEISTAHNNSIRMLPRNTPPLNPLVKSPWVLNNPSSNGKPSTGTENLKKLPEARSDESGLQGGCWTPRDQSGLGKRGALSQSLEQSPLEPPLLLYLHSQELESFQPFRWFGGSLPEFQQLGCQKQIPLLP